MDAAPVDLAKVVVLVDAHLARQEGMLSVLAGVVAESAGAGKTLAEELSVLLEAADGVLKVTGGAPEVRAVVERLALALYEQMARQDRMVSQIATIVRDQIDAAISIAALNGGGQ